MHQQSMIALTNINDHVGDLQNLSINSSEEMRLQRSLLQNTRNDLRNFQNIILSAVSSVATSIQNGISTAASNNSSSDSINSLPNIDSTRSTQAPSIQLTTSTPISDSLNHDEHSDSVDPSTNVPAIVPVNTSVVVDFNVKYKMVRELSTIRDIWIEYKVGINGNLAIETLNREFPNWRKGDNTEGQHYNRQTGVYLAVKRCVDVGKMSEEEALRFLEGDMKRRNMVIGRYKKYLKSNPNFSF